MRNTPLTEKEVNELKAELATLLEKYNVHITWACGGDLTGIYDEKIVVCDNVSLESIFQVEGDSMYGEDLK